MLAAKPTLTNWTSGNPEFLDGAEATLVCKSTPTRPAVSVIWKKGTLHLGHSHEIKTTDSDRLVTVLSVVTFRPQKSDNLLTVSCETSISNQELQKVQQTMTVWCK